MRRKEIGNYLFTYETSIEDMKGQVYRKKLVDLYGILDYETLGPEQDVRLVPLRHWTMALHSWHQGPGSSSSCPPISPPGKFINQQHLKHQTPRVLLPAF